ncbi:MAG TPA: RHS repeat-associated core domain-containing protein, partial [Candidatus Caccousia avistercoris]|nr:RHS repeat-associated core domain-containing protein [Candidatus Caccousia avistercoris]
MQNGTVTSMSSYLYGEATDITTGLQYLRARYYAPKMNGFIQQENFLGDVER